MSCYFESFIRSMPAWRSDVVAELALPEDIVTSPAWVEDDDVTVSSDSLLDGEFDCDRTVSSGSSIPLSRAMTDSEIDYGMYRRLKNRRLSDPWAEIRAAIDAFPPGYLSSLYSFHDELLDEPALELTSGEEEIKPSFDEALRARMERFIEEDCRVFSLDDPGLQALEEALEGIRVEDIVFDDVF